MCVELSEVAYYRGWPTSLGVNLKIKKFLSKDIIIQTKEKFRRPDI
jgi:hypothetical protein